MELLLYYIVGQALTAGAIWGAIRADIRNLHHGVREAKDSAHDAHQRIDNLLTRRTAP